MYYTTESTLWETILPKVFEVEMDRMTALNYC